MIVGLLAVAFTGAWVGRQLVGRLPAVVFRWIVMGMLAVMGVKFFLEGWHGVA